MNVLIEAILVWATVLLVADRLCIAYFVYAIDDVRLRDLIDPRTLLVGVGVASLILFMRSVENSIKEDYEVSERGENE